MTTGTVGVCRLQDARPAQLRRQRRCKACVCRAQVTSSTRRAPRLVLLKRSREPPSDSDQQKSRTTQERASAAKGYSADDLVDAGLALPGQEQIAAVLSRGQAEFGLEGGWGVEVPAGPPKTRPTPAAAVTQPVAKPATAKPKATAAGTAKASIKLDPRSPEGTKTLQGLQKQLAIDEEEMRKRREEERQSRRRFKNKAAGSMTMLGGKRGKGLKPSMFGDLPDFDSPLRKGGEFADYEEEVIARIDGSDLQDLYGQDAPEAGTGAARKKSGARPGPDFLGSLLGQDLLSAGRSDERVSAEDMLLQIREAEAQRSQRLQEESTSSSTQNEEPAARTSPARGRRAPARPLRRLLPRQFELEGQPTASRAPPPSASTEDDEDDGDDAEPTPFAKHLLKQQAALKEQEEKRAAKKAAKMAARLERQAAKAAAAAEAAAATATATAPSKPARGRGKTVMPVPSKVAPAEPVVDEDGIPQEAEAPDPRDGPAPSRAELLLSKYFTSQQVKELLEQQKIADAANREREEQATAAGRANRALHRKLRIVGGAAAGRRLWSSQGEQTRPMMERVRQAVFSMILARTAGGVGYLPEGTRWLDLFAGTGAVGLEALSRGCQECHFVEMDPWVVNKVLRRNAELCGFSENAFLHTAKVEDYLGRLNGSSRRGYSARPFDFISMCPPYLLVSYPQLFELLQASSLLHEGTLLLVEYPRQLTHQIPETVGPLVTLKDKAYGRTLLRLYGPA